MSRRKWILSHRSSERLSSGCKTGFKAFGAIAIVAGPAFRAVDVAAAASSMGILHLEEIEILFPVGSLFIERRIAVANFDPLYPAIRELTGFIHISLVLVARDRTASKRTIFDGTLERVVMALLYLRASPDNACFHSTLVADGRDQTSRLCRVHDPAWRPSLLFVSPARSQPAPRCTRTHP